MSKLQDILSKWLMPIANKVEEQKHLQAIKDGMIAIIPIIIIGSLCILPMGIMNLLGSSTIHDFIANNLSIFTYPDKFTNGLLSLYAAYFIAEALKEKYNLDLGFIGIMAAVCHLIVCGSSIENGISTTYLGAEGLFTAIVTAILVVEISRFMVEHNITITLPDSVPEMVGKSFSSLLPFVINVIVFTAIANICLGMSGKLLPALIMSLLAPAISSMDTLPMLLLVILITQLLWFFGLHGPAITSAVWAPFAIQYAAENIANYAAGKTVTHVFTYGAYYNMLQVTGSGLTIGLVILMMKSKAKSLNSIGKLGIIPSLFGINEPIIFGTPIILNPIMFIPFVFGPLIPTLIVYLSMKLGLCGLPITNPPGFLPPGVGAFLATLDYRSIIVVFVCLAVMTLIYYPFFKIMELEELKKENLDKE